MDSLGFCLVLFSCTPICFKQGLSRLQRSRSVSDILLQATAVLGDGLWDQVLQYLPPAGCPMVICTEAPLFIIGSSTPVYFWQHLLAKNISVWTPDTICVAPGIRSSPVLGPKPGMQSNKAGFQKGASKPLTQAPFVNSNLGDFPSIRSREASSWHQQRSEAYQRWKKLLDGHCG